MDEEKLLFLRWVQFYAYIHAYIFNSKTSSEKKKNLFFSTSCVWSFFWLFNSQKNSFAIFFSFLLLVTFLIEFRTIPNFSQMQTSKNHLWIWNRVKKNRNETLFVYFCIFVKKRRVINCFVLTFHYFFILRLSTTLIKWWIVGCVEGCVIDDIWNFSKYFWDILESLNYNLVPYALFLIKFTNCISELQLSSHLFECKKN